MKANILLLFVFVCQIGFAQTKESKDKSDDDESSYIYKTFYLSTPLRVNQHHGEVDQYSGEKEPFFLPDGLSGRFGVGTHLHKWLSLGANLGIDWKANECLVVAPLFATIKLAPKVGEDLRIYVEPGYGKSFALGRGLSGDFQKISLGIESGEGDVGFYIELCQYGFTKNGKDKIGSLSLGINLTVF
ncbi:MAG TPA: hypothetical protein PKN96_12610 [Flavobacterium sp.]|uniref:hypothetical protein n=1 Tax=Flavobacterium sp. TaxID=239 RepID=UPI002BD9A03D|nr:hypothetical protein [Flavobacterium sp.]HNP34127.1 hypothetical protein [Flavobacterium sp.]